MPINASDLIPAERIALRDRLRSARYTALADAEGFHEICYAVEALGMRLLGKESTLSGYRPVLQKLSTQTALFNSLPSEFPAFFTRFDALYETIRRARNDAMHLGSYARHATIAAVELCIGLEDALMNTACAKQTVADYMVKSPVFVEPWQPIAHARQQMLAHSFSFLPVFHEGQWKLLSELAVVCYLHPKNSEPRKQALALSIDNAVKEGLKLLQATGVKPTENVSELIKGVAACPNPTLWLVIDANNHLTGVLSPFELM